MNIVALATIASSLFVGNLPATDHDSGNTIQIASVSGSVGSLAGYEF